MSWYVAVPRGRYRTRLRGAGMHPSTREPGRVPSMLNHNATVSAVFGKGWLRPRVARSDDEVRRLAEDDLRHSRSAEQAVRGAHPCLATSDSGSDDNSPGKMPCRATSPPYPPPKTSSHTNGLSVETATNDNRLNTLGSAVASMIRSQPETASSAAAAEPLGSCSFRRDLRAPATDARRDFRMHLIGYFEARTTWHKPATSSNGPRSCTTSIASRRSRSSRTRRRTARYPRLNKGRTRLMMRNRPGGIDGPRHRGGPRATRIPPGQQAIRHAARIRGS